MLAGVLAGLLAFGIAKIFGEPELDRAIAFEEQMDKAAASSSSMPGMDMSNAEAAQPELVSRKVQSGLGLFTGVMIYGAAFGGLFALVFAFAYGRIGSLSPRATSALLAGAAFLSLALAPAIKYPANPPAVGNPDTIDQRTELYFGMMFIAIAAMALAIVLVRRLAQRLGGWNASLVGAAVFLALVGLAQLLLPDINEVPGQFSASLLWRFRITSLGIEAVLWTTIGLVFGALAEPLLRSQRRPPAFA